MQWFITLMDKVNFFLKVLIGSLTAIALVVMFSKIVSRAMFNIPLSWSDEFVRYSLVWITFIGAGIAVRYSKLIKLDLIFNLFKVKGKAKTIIQSLAHVLSIVFCVIILFYSYDILQVVHTQTSSTMKIPMSIPYSAIPIGTLIMILNIIVVWIEGEQETDGEELI